MKLNEALQARINTFRSMYPTEEEVRKEGFLYEIKRSITGTYQYF